MRCRKFNKYISKDNNMIVLDFGCGENALFLKSIQNKIKKGYGVDKKYKLKDYKNIEIVNDIKKISDNSMDLITMIAVLEHLDKPLSVISNLYDVLKPGGKIVITTPTPVSKPLLEFLAYKLKIINKEEIEDHKCYYSKDMIMILFEITGFKNVEYKTFQFGFNSFLEAEK